MKSLQIIFTILILGCGLSLTAQSVPQKFKYQGVAKFNGEVVSGNISLQITIRQNAPDGVIIYQERHTTQTNGDGVFATEVGTGSIIVGVFPLIDWANGIYFMQVELDKDGGSEFVDMGYSQLVSVPYALHAATVDDKDDDDPDPMNELQFITFDEATNELSISEGNTILLPLNNTDDQHLSLDGTNLSIENGNAVNLSVLQDGVLDADADPTNELQTWSTLPGIPSDISDGDDVNDADSDPQNELQNLSLNGTQVTISDGNSIDLAPIIPPGGTDDQLLNLNGTNLSIESGNSVDLSIIQDGVDDADPDPTNEIQQLIVDTLDDTPLNVLGKIFLDSLALILSENEDTIVLYDSNPINEFQGLEIQNILPSVASIVGAARLDLTPSISSPILVDASPLNELQTLDIFPFPTPLGWASALDIVHPNGIIANTVNIADTDFTNELQRIRSYIIILPGGSKRFYIILEEKGIDQEGGFEWVATDTICVPDSDSRNELQQLNWEIHTTLWSNDWELQLLHQEVDSVTGETNWVVGDSLLMPDPDPVNEFQKLQISPANISDSKLEILYKDCIPDASGNPETVWIPFMDSIIIKDTDPTNELQQWSNLPGIPEDLSDGDDVDDADADPENEIQNLNLDIIETPNGWKSKLDILYPNGTIANSVFIDDTDVINELQRISPLTTNIPGEGLRFYIVLEEKLFNMDGSQTFQWVGTDTICIPDSDTENELQQLNWEIHTTQWSNDWELQLLHLEMDSVTGETNWIVGDSLLMPDPDPVNEFQKLQISPANTSDSKLEILYKDCIPDSSGNPQTVWIPFMDSVLITDTDPTNEIQNLFFDENTNEISITEGDPVDLSALQDGVEDADADPTNEIQTLSYNPNNQELSLSGGNQVDLSGLKSPWDEDVPTNTVDYNGKAKAATFETTQGAVLIDDTGISRYDPITGENVSNICLENAGGSVWGKFEVLFNEVLAAVYESCVHGSGILNSFGPNGDFNVTLNHLNNFPNNGLIGVVDATNFMRAGAYIDENGDGVIFGDIKNFRMEHSRDPSKEIWYASLEGPEAAAYERGTAQLENGTVFVPFSDHFQEVINPETMTVMLTPLSADTYGLAVVEKKANGFLVKELVNGQGNFEFDWEVKSIRKGLEDFEVIREKQKLSASHHEHSTGGK